MCVIEAGGVNTVTRFFRQIAVAAVLAIATGLCAPAMAQSAQTGASGPPSTLGTQYPTQAAPASQYRQQPNQYQQGYQQPSQYQQQPNQYQQGYQQPSQYRQPYQQQQPYQYQRPYSYSQQQAAQANYANPYTNGSIDDRYHLGTGDKLKITVYGEEDLSGMFVVDGSGQVQLPLVGQVRASGLTIHEFVAEVSAAFRAGYLKDPRISVEVENYRPFYIMGEVNKPGEYPYENGLSVLGAVALAGGYTYRADTSDVYVRRSGSHKEISLPADPTTRIFPGDIIRVPERLF